MRTVHTPAELTALADQYDALADACEAKAEEFGDAVVDAIVNRSRGREVDLHNQRMEWTLYYDANMYREYARALDRLAAGATDVWPLPPTGPAPAAPRTTPAADDLYRGRSFNELGCGLHHFQPRPLPTLEAP